MRLDTKGKHPVAQSINSINLCAKKKDEGESLTVAFVQP